MAQLLTTARAVSMESLEKRDQSGIAVEATWQNIDGEGVADRVDLHTGGMTALESLETDRKVLEALVNLGPSR